MILVDAALVGSIVTSASTALTLVILTATASSKSEATDPSVMTSFTDSIIIDCIKSTEAKSKLSEDCAIAIISSATTLVISNAEIPVPTEASVTFLIACMIVAIC